MRGHLPLIAMRRSRKRPSIFVAVDIHPGGHWLADNWHQWQDQPPQIAVDPSDQIELLDLRFLIALDVCISADEQYADVARRLGEACLRSGASRVFGGLHRVRNSCGELETVELFDSKGILVWPE